MGNWIKKSSQTWKLMVSLIMCLVSAILFTVFFIVKPLNYSIYFSLLFNAIGSAFGMLVFFVSIKCPNCKQSVAYYLIRNSRVQDWLMEFINIGSCPICKSKFWEKEKRGQPSTWDKRTGNRGQFPISHKILHKILFSLLLPSRLTARSLKTE